jgi:hypothetical protein
VTETVFIGPVCDGVHRALTPRRASVVFAQSSAATNAGMIRSRHT